MAGTLILPEKPSEYVWDDYNLVDTGYKWAFGLPSEGQLSSPTCGALPFRNGTGLASPNCIRGEDWVFMDNWSSDRQRWVSTYVFNDWYFWTRDVIAKGPTLEQLSNMYTNLSGLSVVYGSDFQFSDQIVPNNDSYRAAERILSSSLTPMQSLVSQMPPLTGNVPLELSRINNYFTDMPKFKCTITEASHDPPGHHMQKELYYYGTDYEGEVTEDEYFISSMNLPNYYYVPDPPDYRPIETEAQFIGLFYIYTGNSRDGMVDEGWALLKLGDKMTLTQNQNRNVDYQFSTNVHYGGSSLAHEVAEVCGVQLPPQRPTGERAYATMSMMYLYAVVWPKYLTY